jgi:hypothetical protein
VIATAMTPSENASSRLVPMPGSSPDRRVILSELGGRNVKRVAAGAQTAKTKSIKIMVLLR